jgi:hypothetical protein
LQLYLQLPDALVAMATTAAQKGFGMYVTPGIMPNVDTELQEAKLMMK